MQHYYRDLPRGEVDSMITSFNHAVVTQQPERVLAAYLRDVLKVYAVVRVTAPGDPPISRWQFQTSFPYFSSHATPSIVRSAISEFGGGKPAVWRPVAAFLRSYQLDGGYTPGPLLVAADRDRPGGLAGGVPPPGIRDYPAAAPEPACCSSPARSR